MFSGLYQKIKINLLRIKPWSTNSNLPLKPLCSPLEFVTLVRFKFLCNSCHDDATTTTTTTTRRMKTYSGTNRNLYSKFLHKQLFRNRYLLVRSFDRSTTTMMMMMIRKSSRNILQTFCKSDISLKQIWSGKCDSRQLLKSNMLWNIDKLYGSKVTY